MDGLERCKQAILNYEEAEWGDLQPLETFEDITRIAVGYSQYETAHNIYDEQWYVSLDEDLPGIWLEINGRTAYEEVFIDLDALATYLESWDFGYDYLIARADGYCEDMEEE